MIYVCIPSYDEGPTIGLVLWKIRRVFEEFPREYQLLVVDDASTDETPEVLEPYSRVLPLTVVRHATRRGYAKSVEELVHLTLERTDRPKRDALVLMHGDFAHGPQYLPDFVRRLESGADLVVGEAVSLEGEPSRSMRLVRRWSRLLLPGRFRIPGVRDMVSGFAAFRLITLRNALRHPTATLLGSDGWAASAELLARAARHARRIETVPVVERHDLRTRESRARPWETARRIWGSSRAVDLPAEEASPGPRRVEGAA
ncbi:MAG: glycosyltransferase family 2 protein [Gemmatimonadales bacterium]